MKLRRLSQILVAGLMVLTALLTRPVAAQLASNDYWNNPQWVADPSGNSIYLFYDNNRASTQNEYQNNSACSSGGSTRIENDQWYIWQAASTGMATLTGCGSTGGDTKVAVYYAS